MINNINGRLFALLVKDNHQSISNFTTLSSVQMILTILLRQKQMVLQ